MSEEDRIRAEAVREAFRKLAEEARRSLVPDVPVIHPDDAEAYDRHYRDGPSDKG